MANSVRVFAPAKINLFLHVGEKRGDGYHALQSFAVFTEVGDVLELRTSEELTLSINGPFAADLAAQSDNLILKAARLVERTADIVLTKNLPVASGIGGGSADAAAALRGLRELWKANDSDARLCEIAAGIGSDVPVCVGSKPAWMEGRGEVLAPMAGLPAIPMLLVNPGVTVSTADVFRALKTRTGTGMKRPDAFRGAADLLQFLQGTTNDLEAPARTLEPKIADVLQKISTQRGVRLARMSGSGATCFGLFESDDDAQSAAQAISAAYPSWWVRATRIAQ